jgi:hypothetical protein
MPPKAAATGSKRKAPLEAVDPNIELPPAAKKGKTAKMATTASGSGSGEKKFVFSDASSVCSFFNIVDWIKC